MIFSCSNGHLLTVDPALAGRQVCCPLCKEILVAPAASEVKPPVAVLVGPSAAPGTGSPQPSASSAPPSLPNLELHKQGPLSSAIQEPALRPVVCSPAVIDEPPPYAFAQDIRHASHAREGGKAIDDHPPDDDYPDDPAETLRQHVKAVGLGLQLHYWKYLCFAFGILLAMTGAILTALHDMVAILVLFLAYAAGIAAPILGVIGSTQCNGPIIPPQARALILTSLGLDITSLVLSVLGTIALLLSPAAGLILLAVAILVNLASFSLFMLFLRKLAAYLGDNATADHTLNAMIAFLAVAPGGFLVIVLVNAVVYLIFKLPFSTTALISDVVWIVLVIKVLFQILQVIAAVRTRIAHW
jgi:hypothetical protein